jgi:hypothetical protein
MQLKTDRTVQSSKLLLALTSMVILGFGPCLGHDLIYVCLKTVYAFGNGVSPLMRGGVRFSE